MRTDIVRKLNQFESKNRGVRNLIGLVLCGGNSSRMGTDKGTMVKGWQTWSQRAEDLFISLRIPAYISINEGQLPFYKEYHGEETMVVDAVEVKGPLKGLLSAHQKFPDHDLLVMACDMVHMQKEILEELIAYYNLKRGAEVIAFGGNYLEPLCAIYKSSFLSKISEEQKNGKLEDFSLQKIAESSILCRIDLISRQDPFFKNANYKSDVYEQSS